MNDAIAVKLRVLDGEWSPLDLKRWHGHVPARLEAVARAAIATRDAGEDWRAVVDGRMGR